MVKATDPWDKILYMYLSNCTDQKQDWVSGYIPMLRSTSGNSSKFDVSVMLLTSGVYAAGRSRMWSQSIPFRKGCDLISSTELAPSLLSALQHNLQQKKMYANYLALYATKLTQHMLLSDYIIDILANWVLKVSLFLPKTSSQPLTHLSIRSRELLDMGFSGGNTKVSLQFMIFL